MSDPDGFFTELYNSYYQRIYAFIQKRIRNAHDSEELTQEVFLSCYTHLSTFDPDKCSPSTWLFVIANNRLKNYYRDNKKNVDLDEVIDFVQDDDDLITRSIELDASRAAVKKALQRLSERERTIVIRKYFRHESAAEIALALGIAEGNVRTILSRSLTKMKMLMSGWEF